jgi:hypothetical protein
MGASVLLLQILLLPIASISFTSKLTVYLGVCKKHLDRRLSAILIGVVGAIGGIFLLVFRPGFQPASRPQLFTGGALLLLGLGVLFYGLVALRIVWAKRICDDRVWIEGVCEEYLAELPELPD